MRLQKPHDGRRIINRVLAESFLLGKVGMYPLFYASQCKGLSVSLFTNQKPTSLDLNYGVLHVISMKLLKNLPFKIVSYLSSICCLFGKTCREIIVMNPVSYKVSEFLGIHSKEDEESVNAYETA